eukprot:m.252716 g.252716  ORF g.252716 m.252716 type:complete len:98 (+) comp15474_c0_seq1:1669-1962(+)
MHCSVFERPVKSFVGKDALLFDVLGMVCSFPRFCCTWQGTEMPLVCGMNSLAVVLACAPFSFFRRCHIGVIVRISSSKRQHVRRLPCVKQQRDYCKL